MKTDKLRWGVKRFLSALPQKQNPKDEKLRGEQILYFFSGTYGDFVQILPALQSLSKRFPSHTIYIKAPNQYLKAFEFLLPQNLRYLSRKRALFFFLRPASRLFTNVISVYRTLDQLLAYFLAQKSCGFCYGEEKGRRSFSQCFVLSGYYQNYTTLNLAVLDLPFSSEAAQLFRREDVPNPSPQFSLNDPVYFHVGSQGMLQRVGIGPYMEIIYKVLDILFQNSLSLEMIYGPGDHQVKELVKKKHPRLKSFSGPIHAVSQKIQNAANPIICFNSFMAHLCYFHKKRAVVFHEASVPMGYDCGPLHEQVLLKGNLNNSLRYFKEWVQQPATANIS